MGHIVGPCLVHSDGTRLPRWILGQKALFWAYFGPFGAMGPKGVQNGSFGPKRAFLGQNGVPLWGRGFGTIFEAFLGPKRPSP